jgi:hypothetical protein
MKSKPASQSRLPFDDDPQFAMPRDVKPSDSLLAGRYRARGSGRIKSTLLRANLCWPFWHPPFRPPRAMAKAMQVMARRIAAILRSPNARLDRGDQ